MDHLDETTIALFIERRLSDEHARRLEHHIDGCAECRQIVAGVGRSTPRIADGSGAVLPPAVLERGAKIGRYVVLDRVGAGAMGAVYAAFDPDLDRKVAVKLLHRGAADSARLIKEAKALARVSHPGVVAVHDVGTIDDQVFIAMELVTGGTFRTWLRAEPREWRAIVACGVQVARGLAAAHAAGLVHRDVKPDNILVDDKGSARIGDFGLAALREPAKRPSDPLVQAASIPTEITAANAIVGTPAYMAPEQLAGEAATPRSDQFGFCATMYEALFGVRPYNGATVEEIVQLMQARKIADPASDRGVPKRVRAAITRGIDVDPTARFSSMDELVAALTHDPWSRKRIAITAAAGVVLVGGGVAVAVASTREQVNPCTTAPEELARVFTPARRAQVRESILATKLPFAADTAQRVDAALDRYGQRWVTEHTEACEATAVHGKQSPELLDKRMACLDRALVEFDVALETLGATDRERVRHAVDIATKLPGGCADPDRLVAVPPPEQATAVAELSKDISRAHALLQVAAVDKSAELAAKCVERAEKLGYPPLLAEAYDIRGQANLSLGNMKLTRESFEAAVRAAAAARDAELEARSLVNLALVLRDTSADGKVAIEHAKHALAVVQRAKRDPALEAQIRFALIRVLAGIDMTQVMEHFNAGRELLKQSTGRDIRTLKLEYDVIEAKLDINPNTGIEKYQAALPLAEEVYGKDHPQVAAILVEMANLGVIAERYDEVRTWTKRIAEILEPYPGDKIELRRIDAALERDPKKRRPILEEIVKLSEASGGPRSMQLAMDREKLAETLLELEAWKDGLVQIDAAIATWEALYGGQFELMITSLTTKAQLHAGLEQWDEVSKAAERANSIVDKGGMRELVKVMARLILMDSYFRQKRFEEALALIEEAGPTVRIALLGDPVVGLIDFYIAACNWELGRDRPGSVKKAREAVALVKTSELADEATLAPLRAWLRGK